MQNWMHDTITAKSNRLLTTRWPGNCLAALGKGRGPKDSLNLAYAMILPVHVIPPIKMASTTVKAVKVPISLPYRVPHPTKRLADPPDPLNRATISGIEVIATKRDASAPTTAPIRTPRAINSKATIPSAVSPAVIAINIPNADKALPLRAEFGWPSIFKPNMKSTAAAM